MAFISYSHADDAIVRKFHKSLERFRIPKAIVESQSLGSSKFGAVFRDRDELRASRHLSKALEDGLRESKFLIVVCSENSADSHWINQEILFFKGLGRSDQILYLRIDPPDNEPNVWPPASRFGITPTGQLDTSTSEEPLAAHYHPAADGYKNAMLKLVATMLDVNLDELVRRDAAYRQRRLIAIAAGSSIGMFLTLILAIYAFSQRGIAQREAAVSQEISDFMVEMFQLAHPSEARGREVRVIEILNRAARSIKTDLEQQPVVQSRLMTAIGEAYTGLGLYPEAANLFAESRQRRADDRTLLGLADVHQLMGDYEQSETMYHSLLADLPAEPWSETASRANNGLAGVFSYSDRVQQALTLYENILPKQIEYWGEDSVATADTYDGYATALYFANRLEDAEHFFQRAVSAYIEAEGEDYPKVVQILNNLASIQKMRGNLEIASQTFERLEGIHRKYVGSEHPEFGTILSNLGRVYLEQNRLTEALGLFQEARSIDVTAAKEHHPDHVYVLHNLALTHTYLNDYSAAEGFFDRTLTLVKRLNHHMHARVELHYGVLKCRTHQFEDGQQHLVVALAMLNKAPSEHQKWILLANHFQATCPAGSEPNGLQTSADTILAEWGRAHPFTIAAFAQANLIHPSNTGLR